MTAPESPPPKTVVQGPDGTLYVIHGGARFNITDEFADSELTNARPPIPVTEAELNSYSLYPVDGTLVQELGDPCIYIVFGRAKLLFHGKREFDQYAAEYARSEYESGPLPVGSLAHLPLIPIDGTLFKERSTSRVFVIQGGARWHIPTPETLTKYYSWSDLCVAPNYSTHEIPYGGVFIHPRRRGLRSRLAGHSLASRTSIYAVVLLALLIGGASLLMRRFERAAPHGNIKSLGDAIWWSVQTVTTVGYGDRYPVTSAGRTLASVLLAAGIATFGILTASLAAYFVRLTARPETVEGSRIDELITEARRTRVATEQLLDAIDPGPARARPAE